MSSLEPSEFELFSNAVDASADERAALLATIADASLRTRVERLLIAHQALEARPRPLREGLELIGQTFDGFTILAELGRGGMGVVYDALATSPARRVAIKTLKAADARGSARLEREAASLARLSHPGLAQVYGLGRLPDGLTPYLVLERIEGRPIDRACVEDRLAPLQRVALVAEIAETVAHIHTRGVIHRDLKPSNVFLDHQGRTRILDFGIARLLDEEAPTAAATRKGQILGTLSSMAPEQLRFDPDQVDGRADVYALGVLLRELLEGRPPLDLHASDWATACRRLAEEEPPPFRLPQGRGWPDIAIIAAKAMQKRPEDRYPTAQDFASDLRRVLAHEPIRARRPSASIRASRFLRRHRLPTALAILVVAAVAAGATAAGLEAHRARRAEAEARRFAELERERHGAMQRFQHILSQIAAEATPEAHGGQPIDAVELVDGLARDLEAGLPAEPHVRGRLHLLLAVVRHRSGQGAEAEKHLARARSDLEPSALLRIDDEIDLAIAAAPLARDQETARALLCTLEALLARLAAERADRSLERRLCLAIANLRVELRDDVGRAEVLARKALAHARALDGLRSRAAAADLHALGHVLRESGQLDAAAQALVSAADLRRELAPSSLALARTLQNLALVHHHQSRLDLAREAASEAVAIHTHIFGSTPHHDFAVGQSTLAAILRDQDQPVASLPLFTAAAAQFETLQGPHSEALATVLTEHASALRKADQATSALERVEAALAIHRAINTSPRPAHAAALELAANLHLEADRTEPALRMATEALAMRVAIHGAGHVLSSEPYAIQAAAHLLRRDFQAALPPARTQFALRKAHYGEHHWQTHVHSNSLLAALAHNGCLAEAHAIAEAAEAAMAKSLGDHHDFTRVARLGREALQQRFPLPTTR